MTPRVELYIKDKIKRSKLEATGRVESMNDDSGLFLVDVNRN
jgi:hypothetical protein